MYEDAGFDEQMRINVDILQKYRYIPQGISSKITTSGDDRNARADREYWAV